MLPSRKQWVKFRDNHSNSPGKGAVKSVSIGDHLDKLQKSYDKDFKAQAKAAKSAIKDFITYHKKVSKTHAAFAKDFKKDYLDDVEADFKSAMAILKPAEALKGNIAKAAALIGGMNKSSTHRDWTELHNSDPVRLIAMNLGMMGNSKPKLKPAIAPILSSWRTEMNKILPENVQDTPAGIQAAVLDMRKAFKSLHTAAKTARLI